MKLPRLIIAAPHSGSGKTTVTTGIIGALAARGLTVQPYKVGPDYIDPSYHRVAAGRPSRNLDLWMMGRKGASITFDRTAPTTGISVIEGVMGLFDGAAGTGGEASTADVAKLFDVPVILVLDVQSAARSVVAWVLGCRAMDPGLDIKGVILNKVGSERHREMLLEAFAEFAAPPVLGCIPRGAYPALPSRHLGLVPTVEDTVLQEKTAELAGITEKYIDIDALIKIAGEARPLEMDMVARRDVKGGSPIRIGIAMDKAFSFYYQDNLDMLEEAGAELIPFSPAADDKLPEGIAGLYLGGGFPEIYLEELSFNEYMKSAIYQAGSEGMPIWAECGGFMYLCRTVRDGEGKERPMVGLIPGVCVMGKQLAGLGYVEAEAVRKNLIAAGGEVLRGHEFHYSRFVPDSVEFPWAFTMRKRGSAWHDGYCKDQILGTYLHFHIAAKPEVAYRFIEQCRAYLNLEKGVS